MLSSAGLERLVYTQKVGGSTPSASTREIYIFQFKICIEFSITNLQENSKKAKEMKNESLRIENLLKNENSKL
jgi:hypothetical protein